MAQEENEEIQKQQVSSSSTTELEVVDVKKDEENTLKFLDSLDNYLILTQSLSSTLRQGWLELASARYSMGGSRVNSGLLNLKPHSAATTVELQYDNAGSPQFSLLKWASSDDKESSLGKENIEEDEQLNENLSSRNSVERSLESSNESETKTSTRESNGSESKASLHKTEKPLQKERAKVLSMFGTLVSPKLRASQISFETALETLMQIANARSSILEAHDALLKDTKSTKE